MKPKLHPSWVNLVYTRAAFSSYQRLQKKPLRPLASPATPASLFKISEMQKKRAKRPPFERYTDANAYTSNLPFSKYCLLFLLGGGGVYGVFYLLYCKYEKEGFSALEDMTSFEQLLMSRLVNHLGPFFLPLAVEANFHKRALEKLGDPLLLDFERTAYLSTVECITQRSAGLIAAIDTFNGSKSSSGLKTKNVDNAHTLNEGTLQKPASKEMSKISYFLPVFNDLLVDEDADIPKKFLHFEKQLRILMDVLQTLPAEEREVDYEVIRQLATHKSKFWSEYPRNEEYRAWIILYLMQNQQNALKVYEKEKFLIESLSERQSLQAAEPPIDELASPLLKESLSISSDSVLKEESSAETTSSSSANPIINDKSDEETVRELALDYLYRPDRAVYYPSLLPTSSLLLSGEVHDINRKSIRWINKHLSLKAPQKENNGESNLSVAPPSHTLQVEYLPTPLARVRETPELKQKLNLRAFELLAESSLGYAAVRTLYAAEKINLSSLCKIGLASLRSARGIFILEGLYQLEDWFLISSDEYMKDRSFMLKTSGAMAVLNSVAMAGVFYTCRFVLLPFLFLRLYRDTTFDVYRGF